MKRFFPGITILLTSVVLMQCDKSPTQYSYEHCISIYGYLWGGECIDAGRAIYIQWTQPATGYYDPTRAAIANARVTLTDESSGLARHLWPDLLRPGYYYNDSLVVQHRTAYRLEVETGGVTVRARTLVPYPLDITTRLVADSVNAVRPDDLGRDYPLFLHCETLEQIVLVDVYCNEAYYNAEYIRPFHDSQPHPSSQEEYDGGRDAGPRHIRAFMKYADLFSSQYGGEAVIYWYGSMIVFYGSYQLQVLAIDENFHNYLYREHPERSGGIDGGIGLFGSVSGKTFVLLVQK